MLDPKCWGYSLAVLLSVVVLACDGLPQQTNSIDFNEDRQIEIDRYKAKIAQLCENRPGNEYFRLSTESNCRYIPSSILEIFIVFIY